MLSRFIVIEGVNGSGKTYLLNILKETLLEKGYSVLTTKQPSQKFKRSDEEVRGEDLLHKILQDRDYHMREVVDKELPNHDFLLCDRYIVSTLVYQRMDGIDISRLWELNSRYRKPYLTVFLNPTPEIIDKHLLKRADLTRFENPNFRELERKYYMEAIQLLRQEGYLILQINNSYQESPQAIVDRLI
jgi:dTMP kinase